MTHTILLTFDVEDWFQVENFKQCIPFSSWPNCELRVEKNIHRILDLLDSIKLNNPTNSSREMRSLFHWDPTNSSNPTTTQHLTLKTQNSPKATFFILGWLAERLPHLVREIQKRGHEIASHGYGHHLCRKQSADELRMDLVKSKELLEDITGSPVYGYRAPSFSIDHNILSLIENSGYLYDSSFNSFSLNRRYGNIELNGNNGNGMLYKISDSFYELPISNLTIAKQAIPWGGGGYFRVIPSFLFRYGVQSILKNQGAYLFYLHPWEIDSDQPRVSEIPRSFKFRHYVNLDKTYSKLSNFLNPFKNCRFSTCFQYITSSP